MRDSSGGALRDERTNAAYGRRRRRWAGGAVAASLALLVLAGSAPAATFTVNNTGDGTDATPGDGSCAVTGTVCTLRAAIVESEALAGDDAISFAGTLPNPATVTLNTALPPIEDDVDIVGPGSRALTVRRNPAGPTPAFRIFTTDSDEVYIEGMTVTNGRDESTNVDGALDAAGGGIANFGGLELSDVTVTNNTVEAAASSEAGQFAIGGGIANSATCTSTTARSATML